MRAWRQVEKITVTGSGTATFTLRNLPLAISNLTIWAISGGRALTNMTCQPQVNGQNLGSSTNFTAAVAAEVIYSSGGGSAENQLIPESIAQPSADPFVFTVELTEAGGSDEDITLYAVGLTGGH